MIEKVLLYNLNPSLEYTFLSILQRFFNGDKTISKYYLDVNNIFDISFNFKFIYYFIYKYILININIITLKIFLF